MPVTVNRPPSLRVAQDALVVDERLRALVRGEVELDEDPLDVEQVALERVEEAARLEVLRRCASKGKGKKNISKVLQEKTTFKDVHRDALILDDIPDPVPLSSDGRKPKQPERRVPPVRRREDRPVEYVPPVVREDRRQWRPVPPSTAPARSHALRRRRPLVLVDNRGNGLALPLQ